MRIGIHAGLSGQADNAIDDLLGAARSAAEHGLDFWTPQLTDIDALTALAVVGEGAAGPADVAVVGDEEKVAAELRHLADIGATSLSLPVFGSREERQRTVSLLAELAKG